MITNNLVEVGEWTFYRVRIRYPVADGSWGQWHRSSVAPADYVTLTEAEETALRCWRNSDVDPQIEVIEIVMNIAQSSRVAPAHTYRCDDE